MRNKRKLKTIIIALGLILVISIISNNNVSDDRGNNKANVENNNELQLKNASGKWADPISITAGDSPRGTSIGDVNSDGYNDIVNTNFWDHNISIHLWNPILGEWSPQIKKSVGIRPTSASIGDVNADGYNDIVTANPLSDDLSIILWNSTLGDWNPQIRIIVGDAPQFGFIGDANNDGYNDLVTNLPNGDLVAIVLWNPSANDWVSPIYRSVGDSPDKVFVGDANNDGYNDIVTPDSVPDTVSILLFNPASGDWDPAITRTVGISPTAVFIEDANNDGYNDIVAGNYVSNDVSILIWDSVAIDWDPEVRIPLGSDYHNADDIFVGDANNDGYNDIVTANSRGSDITLLLWNPDKNNWEGYHRKYLGASPVGIFIGDANNDGYNDIAVGNWGGDRVDILLWIPPSLYVDIVDQSFSTKEFNITLYIHNELGQGIDSAAIQMWWNGNNVSDNVLNLSNGLFFVSLEPITVIPGEEPILLNMTISALGYEDKLFETYLAVDPDTLEKVGGKPTEGFPLATIIIAISSFVGGIGVAGVSIVLLRRRKRASEIK